MRWIVITLIAFFTSACTHLDTSNSSVIEQLEERFEFDMTTDEDSMPRSVAFIRDLNVREPKATFLVRYKPNASEFVAKLSDRFKSESISKDRYKVELADHDQEKNILIIGRYVRIKSSDCGVMVFSKREDYQFGCSVEHNRNISLVNPIKKAK
ncbi:MULTISPECIES: ATPase [Vibrio]|uniref:ATPase n=2 Tax=Vibrio TaxID=662 RepID=A0A2G1AW17_VIBSP|nr:MULTISPECIES: ATPase [Vibrio]OBT22502.1 ATPase [Vibrio tasmaniensis]NOH20492.1 ATPase [Vibrio cyclitrophicus]NOI92965.1 ATPase [Vibrio splendidus]NOJ15370.1 ATPase [Vibrio splendidus]PHN85928.1 ATPase [Vibrio splendidus]